MCSSILLVDIDGCFQIVSGLRIFSVNIKRCERGHNIMSSNIWLSDMMVMSSLRSLRKVVLTDTLSLLYNARVQPHFNYSDGLQHCLCNHNKVGL